MWKRMFLRSSAPSKTLSEILKGEGSKIMFLGGLKMVADRNQEAQQDAMKVVSYSRSDDYAAWAGEVWHSVCSCIDQLTRSNLSNEEAAFYRGMLTQALDDLKISYKAREGLEQFKEQKK